MNIYKNQAPMKLTLYTLFLFIFSHSYSTAQVSLSMPFLNAKKGEIAEMSIKLKTRDTLAGLQFSLNWDPSVLTFKSVKDFALSGLDNEKISTLQANLGKISTAWFSPDNGTSIKDSLVIFKVQFLVEKTQDTAVIVRFSSSPTIARAYAAPDARAIALNLQNGSITTKTSALGEISDPTNSLRLAQNEPNPVINAVNIPFEILEMDTVFLQIFDLSGKK
ncbi:MAG: hypothetical protein HC817_06865 [Saprospiraceae bacterium]|nr:hypothetical protein [Saprospiraceae bacterium]